MRHFPASCPDCRRLWLVSTAQAPSASPECPRCGELGRLVPGAYYSDPGAPIFERLEAAVQATQLGVTELGELGLELERLLPSPLESDIEAAFIRSTRRIGLDESFDERPVGKRVVLRMLVTIVTTLSQPVVRESGVMKVPRIIPGLFDPVPRRRSPGERDATLEAPPKRGNGGDSE